MDPRSTPSSILPSQPEGQESSDKRSTAKRKPVRRDPEKRRLQNIQAQKKYREKVKKRLDHLNHLEALAASTTESSIPYNGPTDSATTESENSYQNAEQDNYDQSGESSTGYSDLTLSTSNSSAPSTNTAFWLPGSSVDPFHLTHNKAIHNEDTTSGPQVCIGYIDCGCLQPHVQVNSLGSREYRDLRVRISVANLLPADPYANTLRIERLCLIQAILSNCFHIGITEAMLCDDEAISPFFRPIGESSSVASPDSVVTTMQNIFKSLKQDVRPTREQITIRHSPMIDVLPFPTLRKNLLKSGIDVDGEELYHDLLNGLVCWGGGGVGRKDRDLSTGYISTGTPWDSRSWEARTWFLRKYWALLGGEEGELVRQSEWWRNMRGDETDIWLEV